MSGTTLLEKKSFQQLSKVLLLWQVGLIANVKLHFFVFFISSVPQITNGRPQTVGTLQASSLALKYTGSSSIQIWSLNLHWQYTDGTLGVHWKYTSVH